MQQPAPPLVYPPPMPSPKESNTLLLVIVVGVVAVGILAGIGAYLLGQWLINNLAMNGCSQTNSGVVGGVPTSWCVNIGRSADQSNWTLTFGSVSGNGSWAASSVAITVSDTNVTPVPGATNVTLSSIAAGGTAGYHDMYFTPNTPNTVSTGDVLRLSTTSYPPGYYVQISLSVSVVYLHALR